MLLQKTSSAIKKLPVGNISWAIFERITQIVLGLGVSVLLAREMGPERFGQLSFALSYTALFAGAAGLGIDSVFIREYVVSQGKNQNFISTAFYIKLIGAALSIIIGSSVLGFMKIDIATYISTCIILIGLSFQAWGVVDLVFQSDGNYKLIATMKSRLNFSSALIKVVVIYLSANIEIISATYLLDAAILCYFLRRFSLKSNVVISYINFSKSIAVSLLRKAFPLLITTVSVAIYMKIDQLIIVEYMSVSDLGVYSAAVKASESWYFLPMAINTIAYPLMVRKIKDGNCLKSDLISMYYGGMILIATVICLFGTLLSDQIMALLYGSRYLGVGDVFALHLWAGLFVTIGIVNTSIIQALDSRWQIFLRSILGAAINILMCIELIPIMGVIGAAWATLIAYSVSAYFSILLFKEGFKNFTLVTLSPINLFFALKNRIYDK